MASTSGEAKSTGWLLGADIESIIQITQAREVIVLLESLLLLIKLIKRLIHKVIISS